MSVYNGVVYPADPPEGIERDPNQKPEAAVLTIVTGITFTLSTLSIITRLYGRTVLIKKFAFDDCKLFCAPTIDYANNGLQSLCYLHTYAISSWWFSFSIVRSLPTVPLDL
jgi:hypothetical protein